MSSKRAVAMPRINTDFKAGHLALFGVAAVVLLVFAWTFIH
jgi:hypothetical protein